MLDAAVVCSNPWNLEVGNLALQRTWLGSEVYSKTMGTSMKKLFEESGLSGLLVLNPLANEWNSHVDAISQNPRVDIEKVRNITYLYEFDRYEFCLSECCRAKPVTESFRARLGAILPKGHTIVMHPPVTR